MARDIKEMYRRVIEDNFPEQITISFGNQALIYRKRRWKILDESKGEIVEQGLRYGENPHQRAALYELINGNLILGDCKFIEPGRGLVSAITEEDMQQSGKHPGKINLTDIDSGLNILKFLDKGPACVIIKHNNPCGVAYGKSLLDAYRKANMADRIAAFGGCAVFNRPIDRDTAESISENYLEVIAAPDFEEGVIDILKKRRNLRIIKIGKMDSLSYYRHIRFVDFKSLIDGGLIIQESPLVRIEKKEDFIIPSVEHNGKRYEIKRRPTDQEYEDMLFGWYVEQGVSSNSVIYVKDGVTVGIGTGEQDRVGVAEIAIFKAYTKFADRLCFERYGLSYKEMELEIKRGKRKREILEEIDSETKKAKGGLTGSVMISDGFFPFRDGVDVAIREGIRGVVQPGGSLRDWEVIEACNEADVSMVFTGERAFKH